MFEVVWSVHHMHSTLDRVGKASAYGFKYITHDQLCSIVKHELSKKKMHVRHQEKSGCALIASPWEVLSVRKGLTCTSLWQLYQHRNRNLFRTLGSLTVSPEGFPLWEGRWGRVAMCQFRDNILLATFCSSHDHAALVEHIRHVLKTARKLEVECDCISPLQK